MGLSGFSQAWKVYEHEGFLEKNLIIKFALKNTGKSLYNLVKSLDFTILYFYCYWKPK